MYLYVGSDHKNGKIYKLEKAIYTCEHARTTRITLKRASAVERAHTYTQQTNKQTNKDIYSKISYRTHKGILTGAT